ncbi:hypothetical protein GJW-30_1_00942 [Variibacter gotjawalensis]|uniref:Uncharacterized protein n=1 Tax=Variibacter gotjawalensis TaxID=1333996 RepID=A0A0S3PR23_9BRAD|nr:hypothetical protein [Variibacter gotjawalensis]NIK48722.1 FtsZ-interacting cell division protein YlmF [Variibacter gotjawalensis]RZS50583.1 hypothetical protein EV661_3049 [Variibacter gotjawalensis]BAT58417.1 hypothetical protein GJW-30_1_00942 [Variibacter gotjawalensis]
MRLLITAAAIATMLAVPAYAQQQQPQRPQTSPSGQPRQAPPPQQQQAPQGQPRGQQAPPPQAQQQPPAPQPGMFACRTEQEICYVGIALPGNQVTVLYTNNEQSEGIDTKPQAVAGPAGPLDMSQHVGRVIMLVGQYNAQTGISGAEIVDVAGPLLSFSIKSQLSGGGDEEEEEPEQPQQQQRQPQQQQRAPQQQQRR